MPAESDRYARFQRGRAHEFADMVPAEFRPKPETDDDPVTRIIIYIEREQSGGMEYDCVNPSNVELSPGLAMVAPHRAGARLSLSFTVSPRPQDMRIWTRHNTSRAQALSALSDLADTFGYRIQSKPGLRSGPEARVRTETEAADDGTAGSPAGVTGYRGGGADHPGERPSADAHRVLPGTVLADPGDERGAGGPTGRDEEPGTQGAADRTDLRRQS